MTNNEENPTNNNNVAAPQNPYHVHPSETPNACLVTQVLTGDNYPTWSRSMTMALQAKNKFGFVDGSCPQPSKDKIDLFNAWQRCNVLVLSWLLHSVAAELKASIIYTSIAKDVWDDLKARFSSCTAPRIYQLRRSISTLQQGNMTISVYYSKMKGLWDELSTLINLPECSCGTIKELLEYQNNEKIFQLLMGLNDSYNTTRGNILLIKPLPEIGDVFNMLLQDEIQKGITTNSFDMVENSAMNTHVINRNDNYKGKGKRKERPTCDYCKWVGHIKEKCYFLHGYPQDHPLYGQKPTWKPQQAPRPHSFNVNVTDKRVNETTTPILGQSSTNTSPSFTPDQVERLLALLEKDNVPTPFANLSGPFDESCDWTGPS